MGGHDWVQALNLVFQETLFQLFVARVVTLPGRYCLLAVKHWMIGSLAM